MNQEIKFRAWDKEKQTMLFFDNPFHAMIMVSKIAGAQSYDIEIMQYSNVHDDEDDENELFDGDIVELLYDDQIIRCKVHHEGPGFMFVSDSFPDGYIWISEVVEADREYFYVPNCKRIGNIHEHAHSLEG